MKRTVLTMAALVMFAGVGVAEAQKAATPAAAAAPPAAGAAPAAGGGVTYKSKTVYDFDDDTVEGDLVRPDGELIDTRKSAKHSSLIKIRDSFLPEMMKSVESI